MVKKKIKLTIKQTIIFSLVFMMVSSVFVYYFSTDSHVKVLSCKNNYYLSDSEVYDLANVSTKTRLYLVPSILLEKRVEKMPFVQSCKVSKKNRKLTFDVQEKLIVGYYVKDDKNFALLQDGTSIEIEEQYLNMIVHFPLLSDFNAKQRKQLCEQFQKHSKILTRDLIEKFAEIVPYKTSYDKNMFKITMQDGNIVYTNLKSIKMLSKYQSVLTKLKGQSVCLVLDSTHSTIEKVNCEDLNSKKKEEEQKKTSEKTETETSQEIENQEEEQQPDDEETENEAEWVYDENTGVYYHEAIGMYYDPNTDEYYDENGTYYYWDEDSQSFVEAYSSYA
ncbi:OCRE domain-containing protein [uncultured Holdemanella sp.]|uniref:OCRE domain-containing protein n=1 Tax=uncultured Holdemanella sp. TaxID=1763549 RepID=UPI0034272FCE